MDKETVSAYDSRSADFAREWREQPPPDDMHGLLLRHFRPGPTVDIGCGSGRDVAWLLARGYDARGYDASEGLLAEARSACPGALFEFARLPELDGVPRGVFENALCETVIMHLEPPQIKAAVRSLASLLRPEGALWLSWRVAEGESRRDESGRLYSAFEGDLVKGALGLGTAILVDREERSGSSGKTVRRLIVRMPPASA